MEKTARKPQRDPLSPPDWWRKWRPLRWLAGGLVLVMLALWGRQLIESDVPTTEVAAPAPVEAPPAVAEAPAAVEIVPAAPVAAAPAAAAPVTPAPAPTAAAPVPVAVAPPPVAVIEEIEVKPVSDYAAFTKVETSVVDLMVFRSYAGVDSIFSALEKAGYEPRLTSNHRKVPEEFPPYHLDRINVDEYRHLGQMGSLTMQFFNDRLFEVEFQPDDADSYIGAFRGKYPQLKRTKTGRAEWAGGNLRMASSLELAVSDVGRTLRTRAFVLWQDRRIVTQRDGWDARYAPDLVH